MKSKPFPFKGWDPEHTYCSLVAGILVMGPPTEEREARNLAKQPCAKLKFCYQKGEAKNGWWTQLALSRKLPLTLRHCCF